MLFLQGSRFARQLTENREPRPSDLLENRPGFPVFPLLVVVLDMTCWAKQEGRCLQVKFREPSNCSFGLARSMYRYHPARRKGQQGECPIVWQGRATQFGFCRQGSFWKQNANRKGRTLIGGFPFVLLFLPSFDPDDISAGREQP